MSDEQKQRSWTEAPASWNIRYRINGFDEQITLRGETYAELIDNVDKARAYVAKLSAKPHASASAVALNTEPGELEYTPIMDGAFEASAPDSPLTFEVEKLTVTVSEGKKYIKAKGGKFQQFGVSVWPEVLKSAGIDADKLDPMKGEYNVNLVATYALNDKGKPSKVTKLQKAQA